MHVLSCSWWIVISQNKDGIDEYGRSRQWYQPTDWINYADASIFSKDTPKEVQYIISLYTSVLILGTNELGPQNISELLFVTLIMILTSLVNAIIFGEMAVLISLI